MISVVLVDDHSLLREGLRRVLEKEPDMQVVGEAANGAEAVAIVQALEPDVVLMDVVMPELNGIEATKRIKVSNPTTAVIILSAYDDDRYVLGLLEAGVAGYLLKHSCGQEVIQAIRAIHAGDAVLHPAVTARLLVMAARTPGPALPSTSGERPTERELAVLGLAASGLSNKEIATELALSLPTVKAHLVNIFNKTGVGSRTEAVLQALRKGWIRMEDVTPRAPDVGAQEPI
ncbi:MAG: response regulator transcription factor [Dehalococcoidia bacterium]|nr:response regulator transcription factor [Dehalococcoidia bacterium]